MTTALPTDQDERKQDDTVKQADGTKRRSTNAERAAYRANRRFRALAPVLSEYASDLIGKKVKVQAGRQTETDGETIYIEPPYEMSRPVKHPDPRECSERTCAGCQQMDRIMSLLHHEIAHIMHGSFNKYEFTYNKLMGLTSRLRDGDPNVDISGMLGYYTQTEPVTAMHMAAGTYAPLLGLFMALEDHRINEESYKLWPPLRELSDAHSNEIINEGIRHTDGTYSYWSDRSADDQMMILVLLDAQGIDCEGNLDAQVIEDYKTSGVKTIAEKVVGCGSSQRALEISADVMGKLMKLGYFTHNTDEVMQALIDLLKMLFGHGVEGMPDVGEGGPGIDIKGTKDGRFVNGKRRGPGDYSDPFTEVEFRKAFDNIIVGGSSIDGAPQGIAGVETFAKGEGPMWGAESRIQEADGSARNKAVNKARLIFEENGRVEYHRNQRRGKLNGRALGKRAWSGDERLFQKRNVPDTRTYEVLIGLDISGSTARGPLDVIRSTAHAMADVCHRAGINFEILAHTGERMSSGKNRGEIMATVYEVKGLKDRWDTDSKRSLARISSGGGNLDGHTMQFYRKRLDASTCTDKIMFYFTDGAMPAANGANERPILERELKLCKQRGYHVVGVGIGTDSPKEFGMDTVIVNGPNDISAVLDRLATKFSRK